MKKLFLTLIVSVILSGSAFAQYNSDQYVSHWIDQWDVFTYCPYDDYDYIIPFITIDGEYVTLDVDYEAIELAAFIDGECRGHSFLIDDGEAYPFTEISVYRNAGQHNQVITFMLYDHANQIEYVGTNTLINGIEYDYQELYESGDYDLVPVLDFTLPEQEGYTLEIDQYTGEKDNYYLIASPVGAVTANLVTGLRTPNFDFYSFNQAAEDGLEWINLRDDETFELQPGVGYLYANNTGTDLTFNGTAYTGDGNFDLVYEPDAEFAGWNLVGNPYAEDAFILCRDYLVLNGETFETILQTSETPIAPMNGAFVIADGEDDYVTFATSLAGAPCDEVGEDDKLVINASKGRAIVDRAIVRFGEGRTLPKFQIHENSTRLYFPVDGQDYAVVRAASQGELPLNFKAETSGSYTLSFNAEAMDVNYLHLIDNLNGNDVDLLSAPTYTFDASTTDYASRFRLVFATGNADETFAFASNGSFVISNEGNATVQVVDVNGRILSSQTINGSASISVNAAAGVYMIRLINGDNVKVQKVVVK